MTLPIPIGWLSRSSTFARYPQSGMIYSMAEYYPKKSVGQFRATKGTPADIRALVQSGYLPSICHPTVTLKVEKALAVGGYRFDLHVEDIDLWWRMALNCDIQMIPEVTLGFRQHLKSVSATNLERQALSILYVQYLLLSHLSNLTPLSYAEAQHPLSLLFNRRQMKFKVHLRTFNIEMGRGQLLRAACEAGHALFASPKDLSRRILDEIVPNRCISVGQPPSLFARYQSTLWPDAVTLNAHSEVPSPLRYRCGQAIESMRRRCWEHISKRPPAWAPIMKVRPGFQDGSSISLAGLTVNPLGEEDIVRLAAKAIESHSRQIIGNHNLHSIYFWYQHSKMRHFYEAADYIHIDGMFLILLGNLAGFPLRRKHRGAALDFFPLLAQKAITYGWRIFYLGSRPGVAEKAANNLRGRFPGLQIRTHHGHFNADKSGEDNQRVLAEIRDYAPQYPLRRNGHAAAGNLDFREPETN